MTSKNISEYISAAFEVWKQSGKDLELKVRGLSMTPLINTGDKISLRLMDPFRLRRGDICAFLEGNNVVVHRLLKKKRINGAWLFRQKGDNLTRGSWISENRVLGRIESIQGRSRTLHMTRWPWTWINPSSAVFLSLWTALLEKARTVNAFLFGHRPSLFPSCIVRIPTKLIQRITSLFMGRKS